MAHLIDKDALVAELERRVTEGEKVVKELPSSAIMGLIQAYKNTLSFVDTLEVKDPYEQLIQYASIESGIKAHAEVYSFNIESELFNQLTKEQQALWRKEIEQACISGGYNGLDLAKDPRYKENLEVKEVDLEKELNECGLYYDYVSLDRKEMIDIARHFFELGARVNNPIIEVNLESLVRQVIDLYLEAGEHYNSVIKEERKEYGGSDLAIKLFDGVIDAKELGIQYVLDKLKAQKGENE